MKRNGPRSRRQYVSKELAVEIAQAIERHTSDPGLREMANAIIALLAPYRVINPDWERIEQLVQRIHESPEWSDELMGRKIRHPITPAMSEQLDHARAARRTLEKERKEGTE